MVALSGAFYTDSNRKVEPQGDPGFNPVTRQLSQIFYGFEVKAASISLVCHGSIGETITDYHFPRFESRTNNLLNML
jgi:hypothetical protein